MEIRRPYMDIGVKAEVLDLSKRRDSVETRNTPSPYNTSKSTDDSPNARNHSECNSSDYTHTDIMTERLSMDVSYNHFPNIIGRSRSPGFNRSLSPVRETNAQNILPIPNIYSAAQINPFLLQSAVLQKDLIQAKNFKNIFETNPNLLLSEPTSLAANIKHTRPFKAYPTSSVYDNDSANKYAMFRNQILGQISANGSRVTSTKRTRSNSRSSVESHPSVEGSPHIDTTNTNTSNSAKAKEQNISNNNNNNVVSNSSSVSDKDESYRERRRKNNAAAKKSRDRRRFKEDEIAIRAAFLERENLELKFENAALRKQLAFYEAATTS
ncbi:protein giant [Culicoides brevitarsis]|uniref:protein giant n=1 Tax=Culicoides brevitarsis TaxID=469753 RepID=UPI00307CC4F9